MRKLFIASLLVFAFCKVAKADIVGGVNGWYYTHIGSSGSIFTGAGEVGAIFLSSGPSTTIEYGIGVDTQATTAFSASVLADATNRVTPALTFNSTTTLTNDIVGPMDRTWDATSGTGEGLQVRDGFYWFPTANASGEALRAIVKWRRSRN